MANSTLTGKSVVVTGGLSGIGLALVRFFASYTSNISISILDISPKTSSTVLTQLRTDFPHAKFSFETCDISNWEQSAAVFKSIYQNAGSIDIVCANAGVTEVGKFLTNETEEDGEPKKPDLRTLNVNLIGTLYTVRLGVFYMRKNNIEIGPTKSRGLVICTASNAGLYPLHIAPMYTTSKHAIVGAVRSLSRQLEADAIRINAICPNCIETGLADDNLFSAMKITPMSTLLNAVQEFVRNESLTGQCAEISGEKHTFRDQPEYVDDMTRDNLEAFWTLGYA